jgi:hypothetical protein
MCESFHIALANPFFSAGNQLFVYNKLGFESAGKKFADRSRNFVRFLPKGKVNMLTHGAMKFGSRRMISATRRVFSIKSMAECINSLFWARKVS